MVENDAICLYRTSYLEKGSRCRKEDFNEIYAAFPIEKAQEQASRCEQCGIPYCSVGCPVNNNIPDWLRLVSAGRLEDAYHVSQETNSLPEICGLSVLKTACVKVFVFWNNLIITRSPLVPLKNSLLKPLLKKAGSNLPNRFSELGQSVGIIGAGPVMAAADRLYKGYEVHLYIVMTVSVVLLIYGIRGFKLEKEAVERRAKLLEEGGVHFHLELRSR